MGSTSAIIHCIVLEAIFIGSLYVWKGSTTQSRDHPEQIKKRCVSVGVVTLLTTIYVTALFGENPVAKLGFSLSRSMLLSFLFPLVLTVLLFAGPIAYYLEEEGVLQIEQPAANSASGLDVFKAVRFDWQLMHQRVVAPFVSFMSKLVDRRVTFDDDDWRTFRAYIAAPFAEEFVFRGAMCAILVFKGGFSTGQVCLITSLFFGFAHVHHIFEHVIHGQIPIVRALFMTLFQLCYTTVFGSYSAYVFMQTGNCLSIFIVHAFCNFMGFPDFGSILQSKVSKYVLFTGVALFVTLFKPLLSPTLYTSVYNMQ